MSIMAAQMGLSLASSFGDFQVAKINQTLQSRIQDYQNTMRKLSASRANNAVTLNEIRTRDASVQADSLIQRTALKDQARAEVDAAAAGVKGGSVESAARDLRMSASRATYAQKRQAHQQLAELSGQRTSIALSVLTQNSNQVIPKPSIGAALLGAGTNLLSIYDSHQPEGSKLLG